MTSMYFWKRATCERITRDVPGGKRGNSFNLASSGCPGFHLRRPSARTGLPVLFSSPTSLATPSLDRLTPSCVISKLQPARGHQPAPDSDRPSSVACRQLLFCGSLHAGWLLAKVRMSPQVLAGGKPGCTPCRRVVGCRRMTSCVGGMGIFSWFSSVSSSGCDC